MRTPTVKRITGTKLQQIRKAHLKRNPLCVRCLARNPPVYRLAQQIDHIVSLRKQGLDVESNRQGLCIECHREKTAEEFGLRARERIGSDGYPTAHVDEKDEAQQLAEAARAARLRHSGRLKQ